MSKMLGKINYLIWNTCIGLLLVFSQPIQANHIFGGNLSLTQLNRQQGRFRVKLQMYVDLTAVTQSDDQALRYNQVFATIYRQRDNKRMGEYELEYSGTSELIYKNQACAKSLNLRTREYRYTLDVVLPPNEFADTGGYYLVWERCCRNEAIINIQDAINTGIALRTDFPPLLENGNAIAFSTPVFPVLNGDYICVGKNFSYDFGATDPNGDELRYSLVTPLKGHTSQLFPQLHPLPAPYQPIAWTPGFSLASVIPGNPSLRIDEQTGQLSLRADRTGIFVFTVECRKYRNGKLLGATRHEFQFAVVDCLKRTITRPEITYQGQSIQQVSFCPGDSVRLETTADPTWAFQWQKNGYNLEEATSAAFVVKQPGDYRVVKGLTSVCATDTISSVVHVAERSLPAPVAIQSMTTSLCSGDSVNLTASSSEPLSFEWYRNGTLLAKGKQVTIRQGGQYQLLGRPGVGSCSPPPDTIQISEWPKPSLPPGQRLVLCSGESVELSSKQEAGWTYRWLRDNQLIGQTGSIIVGDTGLYVVEVVDNHQCYARSTPYQVSYRPDCPPPEFPLLIPNSFTPNGDGLNDRWEIRHVGHEPVEVTIFDRWGEVIYSSPDYAIPWDGTYLGTAVKMGVYTFLIRLPNRSFTYQGTVTVVR